MLFALVILWSTDSLSAISRYFGHSGPVWGIGSSSINTSYFATASGDRTVRLWNSEFPNSLRILTGHFSDVEVDHI
jgi:transcription initiation factor TFIID subunit 5